MDFDMFLQEPRTVLTENDVLCTGWHYASKKADIIDCLMVNAGGIVQIPSSKKGNDIHSCYCSGQDNKKIEGLILPIHTINFHIHCFPNLRWIWIPKQARIYDSVFEKCSKLESVYFEGTAEQWDRMPIQYYADAYGFNKTGQMFVKRRSYFSRLIPLMHSTVYFECSREAFQ